MITGKYSSWVRSAHFLLMLVIFSFTYVIFGCSSPDPTPTPTAVPTATPVVVVVTDALGQNVSFENIPTKIATISPTATEILYLVGGTSILRDRASTFPDQVKEVPDVGSAYNPSIETILTQRPDLVIIEALTQARFMGAFKEARLKEMAVKAETVDDIKTSIKNVGKAIGKEEVALEQIAEISDRLATVGSEDDRTILMLISDQDRNLYAARPESYTGLIATTLGLDNMAAGMPDAGPYRGFAIMSTVKILASNPDIIITITPAPAPAPRLSDSLVQIPPFRGLKAIISGNVIEADVELFLQAPGPRIVEAVEFLKERTSSDSS